MRCPDCGHDVPEQLMICPQCGQNVEQTQPMKRRRLRRATSVEDTIPFLVSDGEKEAKEKPDRTLWQRLRVVLIAFSAFLCLLTISSGVGVYVGSQHGEATRVAEEDNLVADHYQLGVDHLQAAEDHYRMGVTETAMGEVELAIAEFDFVLRLEPDHTGAATGMDRAEDLLVILSATPTPTLDPNADIEAELFAQGQAAYEAGDWEEVIQTLGQLRVFAPGYETRAVEEMLFESLYTHGLNLLADDQLEEGIFHLEQAQEIGSLEEVEGALLQLELARRYLDALGFWEVDWQECIERFGYLYEIGGNYQDVFTRLYQAHVRYGDLWAERGEMCPAAAQYAQALELMSDPELEQKRDEAAEVCAVATPTPVPPITGTIGITGTVSVPDFRVGRLAYPIYNQQTGMHDIYALTADGRLLRMAGGADQPSWQWGTDRLIYRDRLSGGISTVRPGEQPVLLLANSGAAWPTLSPDGGRYAYAARDEEGFWQIYLAPTDGSSDPAIHASGWEPAWGPTGLLAWTGCDDDGVCGIFADNPDDDQPPNRLTSSINDSGLHWAPGGDLVAYMADHTGAWNIYLLSLSGGVQVVTEGMTLNALPAWAPDGSSIAFLSYREDLWGIYLMDPSGENVRKIIDLGSEMPNWENQRLSWAP